MASNFQRVLERARSALAVTLRVAGALLLAGCARDPVSEVRGTLADERWVKPRLSLDGPVEVCPPEAERPSSMRCGEEIAHLAAQSRLARLARRDTAETRIPVAVLLGSGSAADHALSADSTSSEWADLAALELVLGARSGQRRAWPAVEAAGRALELDPSNRRAMFNQALAYEELHLAEAARASWRSYLELEPEPLWRREAEEHLRWLGRPTVQDRWRELAARLLGDVERRGPGEVGGRFVFEVRQRFLDGYLSRWPGAPGSADPCADAGAWLTIGQEHHDVSGDALIVEAVRWLLESACEGPAQAETGRALRRLVEALELYERAASAASLDLLQRARPQLEATASPLVDLVDLYSAINIFALNRYAEAAALFAELEPRFLSRDFLFLAARAAWLRGTIALRNQDLASAVAHYRRARDLFDRLKDLSHQAAIRGLLAETLARMGLFDEAWRSGLDGLGRARQHGHVQRLYAGCSLLGIVAALEGDHGLAALFQECALEHVRSLDNRPAETDTLLWQAAWLQRSGRAEEAREALEEARASAARITDSDEKAQARADLALIEATLELPSAPRKALERLAGSIDFFDEIGHHYYASDARLLQARAARSVGEVRLAERSLVEALDLHERFRVGDADPASRLAVLQSSQTIYDRLARHQLDERRDAWRALFFADRGKQDRYNPIRPPRSSLEREIERTIAGWQRALLRLPARVTLASYQLLPDELLTFVLRIGEKLVVERTPLPDGLPPAAGDGLRTAAWTELLSAPLAGRLAPGGVLVVVADKQLNGFPLARLVVGADASPTAPAPVVVAATSLDDFLLDRPPGRTVAPRRVSAFLAPQRPPTSLDLPPLRASESEAAVLESAFERAEIWRADKATADRFLASVRSPGVVHFSGHVLVNERRPLETALLFPATESRPDGRVTARELYEADAYAASLVSLAGCGSAAAPRLLPFSLSLARPFLSAGVPAVVGSLRPLSDELFVRFATAFYDELGRSDDLLSAFGEAQRSLRRQAPASDLSWAEIQLYATKEVLDSRRTDA